MKAASCCQTLSPSIKPFPTPLRHKSNSRVFASPSSSPSPSARTQLDLLEQLAPTSAIADAGDSEFFVNPKIRDQLIRLVGDRDDDFTLQLGPKNLKKVSPKFVTVSQKRNIKRQEYLNNVSKRNDTVFFATIGVFVIVPPVLILALAISTGYVQLFP